MGPEMPQRIEISLVFSWRLLELKAGIIQHVQCSCDMDRRTVSGWNGHVTVNEKV